MTTLTTTTLESIDQGAYPNILQKMEYSLGVTFNNRDLEGVSTFGALCDIVTDKLTAGSIEERIRQQVFHKIRYAIAVTQPVDKTSIRPDSAMDSFFPRKGRQQRIKAFQKAFGVDVSLLVINNALEWAIIICAATSFVSLFFGLVGAVSCVAFTAIFAVLANIFGKELKHRSVQQLAEEIAREHYNAAGYHPASINKTEIGELLEQLFVYDVDFAPAVAAHDARMTG